MNWDDFDTFCQVVEHSGFTVAARALDRPKSSLSASVARLEEQLGTRLQAALAGLGVTRITATFCAAAVQQGRLVRLLPNGVARRFASSPTAGPAIDAGQGARLLGCAGWLVQP